MNSPSQPLPERASTPAMRLREMVLDAMQAIVNALLFLFASSIVLSLMQQRQATRKPTGLKTHLGVAES
jgi:hypothetical protein